MGMEVLVHKNLEKFEFGRIDGFCPAWEAVYKLKSDVTEYIIVFISFNVEIIHRVPKKLSRFVFVRTSLNFHRF